MGQNHFDVLVYLIFFYYYINFYSWMLPIMLKINRLQNKNNSIHIIIFFNKN